MNLDEFIHDLHFDVDKVRPVDLPVDWDNAPLPYKIYRGLPSVELPEAALSLDNPSASRCPFACLTDIGNLFWYAFGLTQLCQSFLPGNGTDSNPRMIQMLRRFAPSGGALYPSEMYAYLKIDGLAHGVYHYDVAHHRLVLLREGNFDAYLDKALGLRCDLTECFGTIFVSTVFWKNFYKYNNFAYRLQGLDAGALLGQFVEAAKRVGITPKVHFQFLDHAVNHLLGLTCEEESVYAVVPMANCAKKSRFERCVSTGQEFTSVTSESLCSELAPISCEHYLRSRKIEPYPMLLAMNKASVLDSTGSFRVLPRCVEDTRHHAEHATGDVGHVTEDAEHATSAVEHAIKLPRVNRLNYDFALACRKRYSPGLDFVFGQVRLLQLATLFSEATESLDCPSNLDDEIQVPETPATPATPATHVSLVCCLHGVEGIQDGAYAYDPKDHALNLLRPGDQRMWLQQGLSMPSVNLFQVPLCFHIVGSIHRNTALGYRGHRILHMEAGMMLERLLLASSALSLGAHPLLGYDEALCDEIYNFTSSEKTCLIQIPVGPYRTFSRLDSPLY